MGSPLDWVPPKGKKPVLAAMMVRLWPDGGARLPWLHALHMAVSNAFKGLRMQTASPAIH